MIWWPRLLVRLLETRLVEVLRFQRGQVPAAASDDGAGAERSLSEHHLLSGWRPSPVGWRPSLSIRFLLLLGCHRHLLGLRCMTG